MSWGLFLGVLPSIKNFSKGISEKYMVSIFELIVFLRLKLYLCRCKGVLLI